MKFLKKWVITPTFLLCITAFGHVQPSDPISYLPINTRIRVLEPINVKPTEGGLSFYKVFINEMIGNTAVKGTLRCFLLFNPSDLDRILPMDWLSIKSIERRTVDLKEVPQISEFNKSSASNSEFIMWSTAEYHKPIPSLAPRLKNPIFSFIDRIKENSSAVFVDTDFIKLDLKPMANFGNVEMVCDTSLIGKRNGLSLNNIAETERSLHLVNEIAKSKQFLIKDLQELFDIEIGMPF